MLNRIQTLLLIIIIAAVLVPSASSVFSQTSPDEHSEHHPPSSAPMASPSAATAAPNANANNPAGMTGGMDAMGEMMKGMGNRPPAELYPSLIQMQSSLSPEVRSEISNSAAQRMAEGNRLVASGLEDLTEAAKDHDPVRMREANAQIREGQRLLESALSVEQALGENQNPQDISIRWFKQNMDLAPAAAIENPHGFFGLSWFHYISMLTLAAFSVAMIWMYFRKMKRANSLLARLTGGSGTDAPLPATSTADLRRQAFDAEQLAVNPDIAPSKPNSWSGTLMVSKIFDETPKVKTFRLTDPTGGKIPFNYLPGQFVTVTVVPNGVPVKRSYTIASSPTKRDYCEITVKHEELGTVSHYLNTRVHEGELLQLTGPSGKFTFLEQESDSIVLIAGGVGVTPLMSVVRYLTDRSWKGDIFFFFACLSAKDVIFREEIEYLRKRYPNLHVWLVLDEPPDEPEPYYLSGRITKDVLLEHVPEIASRRVHICGPPPMIDAVKRILDELDVPKENVKTEIFAAQPPPRRSIESTPEQTGNAAVATFARSKKTAVLPPDKTILEASEDVGVNIDYSCRVGTCGICKTKLLSGKVTMAVEEALTDDDRANNIILACQAKATEDVAVDA